MSDLLSEEFFAFTDRIRELYRLKQEKRSEMKRVYEQFQQELADLEAEARKLEQQFRSGKAVSIASVAEASSDEGEEETE